MGGNQPNRYPESVKSTVGSTVSHVTDDESSTAYPQTSDFSRPESAISSVSAMQNPMIAMQHNVSRNRQMPSFGNSTAR